MSVPSAGRVTWLAGHAFLAILLTLGFYVLAISLAALLLFIPIGMAAFERWFNPWLTLVCFSGAGGILWSIMPRRAPWIDPGPRLVPQDQAQLFAAIEEVSRATGERMPDDVYIDLSVNAAVFERRRFLWFGRRRVLLLGLPFMVALTRHELMAVLGHEFGHFHGGDLALAPLIRRTRVALALTLSRLPRHVARLPFQCYGWLYMRLTLAIGRHQEQLADALAARVIGADAMAGGLKKAAAANIGFLMFWESEYAPALEADFRLPLIDGLRSFLLRPRVGRSMAAAVAQELEDAKADPYDTHPPTAERLSALGQNEGPRIDFTGSSAADLLGDIPSVESALLRHTLAPEHAAGLKALRWEDAAEALTVRRWRNAVSLGTLLLNGRAVRDLPDLVSPLGRDPFASPAAVDRNRAWTLGAALGMALHRAGWRIRTSGAVATLEGHDLTIDPFEAVADLASGDMSPEAWRQRIEVQGIAALPLDDRPR